jgi:hypothetical protein
VAYDETKHQVVGVTARDESRPLPALASARSYPDLADAVHRPGEIDAELVRRAASDVTAELGNELNQVDVNAMVIAGINRSRASRQ